MVHKGVPRVGWLVLCLATVAAPIASQAIHANRPRTAAQDPTVWQGVYSAEQADRGRTAYERHCASCHGNDLAERGTEALLGEAFMRNWSESSVYDLLETIR